MGIGKWPSERGERWRGDGGRIEEGREGGGGRSEITKGQGSRVHHECVDPSVDYGITPTKQVVSTRQPLGSKGMRPTRDEAP
jgi:hypothetical protein